jgi:hypothetical protein
LGGSGASQRHQAQSQGETPVVVSAHQPVDLKRTRQAVGSGTRHPGGVNQPRQRQGTIGECIEHGGRLVNDADATYSVFHITGLLSHNVR